MSLFLVAAAVAASIAAAPAADLEIREARLDYARPADTFGYSAIVTNNGPDSAQGVEILVLLPPGVAMRNAEPCIGKGALVRCALGTLRPGEERRVFMLVLTSARASADDGVCSQRHGRPECRK